MPPGSTITIVLPTFSKTIFKKLHIVMDIYELGYFKRDSASCHTAKGIKNCSMTRGIQKLGLWPGSSPDLNPIENFWAGMLRNIIKELWTSEILGQYCENLSRNVNANSNFDNPKWSIHEIKSNLNLIYIQLLDLKNCLLINLSFIWVYFFFDIFLASPNFSPWFRTRNFKFLCFVIWVPWF